MFGCMFVLFLFVFIAFGCFVALCSFLFSDKFNFVATVVAVVRMHECIHSFCEFFYFFWRLLLRSLSIYYFVIIIIVCIIYWSVCLCVHDFGCLLA